MGAYAPYFNKNVRRLPRCVEENGVCTDWHPNLEQQKTENFTKEAQGNYLQTKEYLSA